jgi:peptide/nickel transport system permease protein
MYWTLVLAIPATVFAAFIGGALGLQAGYRSDIRFDMSVSGIMLVLLGIPANCLAILFLLFFSFKLEWFPIGGLTSGGLSGFEKFVDILWHMVLPVNVLTLLKIPADFMLMKSTVHSLRDEEYLDVARSKGFTRTQVLRRHMLKNVLCPYLTSLCVQFGQILAGSMLVEVVFSWKGMGTLIYDSVNTKDFPMLQTSVLFICACVVICNILADILNMLIDPRLREVYDV